MTMVRTLYTNAQRYLTSAICFVFFNLFSLTPSENMKFITKLFANLMKLKAVNFFFTKMAYECEHYPWIAQIKDDRQYESR